MELVQDYEMQKKEVWLLLEVAEVKVGVPEGEESAAAKSEG